MTKIVAPLNYSVEGEPYPFERELTVDEYEVRTRPTGSTLRLDFPGDGKFLVSGTWGWQSVPGSVEKAVMVTVDEWYRGNVLPPGGTREEGESESRNIDIPREVKESLQSWILKELIG